LQSICLQVNTAAVSTVDYIALVCVMNDMRLKLLEDTADQQRVSDWKPHVTSWVQRTTCMDMHFGCKQNDVSVCVLRAVSLPNLYLNRCQSFNLMSPNIRFVVANLQEGCW